MNPDTLNALIGFFPTVLPEAVLGVCACVLFLGGTWRPGRALWGSFALLSLAGALLAVGLSARAVPTAEDVREHVARVEEQTRGPEVAGADQREAIEQARLEYRQLRAEVYAAPVLFTRLALLFKVLAIIGAAVLVLFSWDEMPADQAADYHACILLMAAGVGLVGAANELVTLFLALEVVSIPTYVLLYLPRLDEEAQEAAMKYFLLSIFSSALLLFGFSYLYGLAGTTNIPAMLEALSHAPTTALPGVALVALVTIVAGLGFRITAVPFHFYAPDVYQGTTTGAAALLAFIPKVAGFAALLRVLGFVPSPLGSFDVAGLAGRDLPGQALGEQVPVLLWIVAAVTMSLGNVLALLQDNLKRLLAYSSVAHAGYMLIGLAVAPKLAGTNSSVGGVEAVVFYLVAYAGMTIGAFAVIHYLHTPGRPVETVDDLAGLGKSHPGIALVMALFLFSLIGIPLTAGFAGKFMLFFGAVGVPYQPQDPVSVQQFRLYLILALIGAINAAVGGWYYLRIAAAMFLREPLRPVQPTYSWPVRAALAVCVLATLVFGVYPWSLLGVVQKAIPHANDTTPVAVRPAPGPEVAARPAE